MKFSLIFVLVSIAFLFHSQNLKNNEGQTSVASSLKTKVLTQNLTLPWEILWGPDGFIWMTEREGRLSRVHPATGKVTLVYTPPDIESNGEGGLLGMALHPQFSRNPYVYLSYNHSNHGAYKEKVVRFTYNGTTLNSPKILIDNIAAAGIHNGSRLLIHKDKLYITTGDAADQPSAQNKNSLNGKILRINLDGTIPADNPFGDALWSWGHRNPQGLIAVGNTLFSSEHGPESNDEINIIEKGRNYGWPTIKGFCNDSDEKSFCTDNQVKEPLKAWTPTAAVCGLDYYESNAIPQWKNSLLLTSLKNSRLYQLKLNETHTQITGTTEFFKNDYGRLRDVCVAPDGKVYLCTSNGSNDKIIVASP